VADHNKFKPMDNKLSLKGVWLCHMTSYKFWGPNHSSQMAEAGVVKLYTLVGCVKY